MAERARLGRSGVRGEAINSWGYMRADVAATGRAQLDTTTGPRAVPGSQRPGSRKDSQMFPWPPMRSHALRAGTARGPTVSGIAGFWW